MKIGYLLDTHGGPYDMPAPSREQVSGFLDQLFREAELVEELGFDSLLVPERHGRPETFVPTPLLLLSALAVRTARIRLGTYILLLPLHDPMHVAEQFATIDQLSRGRAIFGVAAGYHAGYSQMFNVPHHHRGACFEEGFEVVMRAWSEERFSFEGEHYQYRDVSLTPKPYQQPRPEVWIGGMFPKTIARAGRLGDSWCSDPFPLDPEVWHEQVQIYRKSAADHGRSSTVTLMRDAWVAPTRRQADETFVSIAIEENLFYHRHGILTHHPDFRSEADFTHDRMRKHLVCGTPDDCRRQLEMYRRDYDVDTMILRFRLPLGPPGPEVIESLKLFGKEVLPAFGAS
jgi:alkanesulfonate monooxygenase SsuD/methylene tetrahydromethanopterin reductase-like flavin-dependent oxidoreductase (luciferase family)